MERIVYTSRLFVLLCSSLNVKLRQTLVEFGLNLADFKVSVHRNHTSVPQDCIFHVKVRFDRCVLIQHKMKELQSVYGVIIRPLHLE